jgi:hypothetical protein
MIWAVIVISWIAVAGDMGARPCPGPGTCVEPPRPEQVRACYERGEPC